MKEISNLICGIWLYNMDRKDIREEILDSTYKSTEKNLMSTQIFGKFSFLGIFLSKLQQKQYLIN